MENKIYCQKCTYPLNKNECQNPSCELCKNKLLKKQWLICKYISQIDEIKDFLEEQLEESYHGK